MNLEPYAPAASLLLLALLALVAFVRVRMLMKRYGLAELYPEEKAPVRAQPWWSSHLDDYTREAPAAPPVGERGPRTKPELAPGPAVLEPAPASMPESAMAAMAPDEGTYVMTAPVELWFGDSRVAVRPGSDTDARFRRFAKVLLDELKLAQERA